ncbi:MAG TPA: hypothetical protein PLA50_12730, partial [Bacteroidia bacterium]|nr:hypothetical protein [Bacteroidia bacterium]
MKLNRLYPSLTILFAAFTPLAVVGEDLTPKVKALFESKCKECHHPDTEDDAPYLHEGFNLAELIDEDYIAKGKPEESSIFTRVSMDPTAKKRMPKSAGAEGDDSYRPPLTADEQKLVKDWIAQLGQATPAPETKPEPKPESKPETKPAPAMTSIGTPAPADSKPEAAPKPESKPEAAPKPENAPTATVEDKDGEMPASLDLAGKVKWIFAERCSQCHEGDYEPELHGSVSLMNFFTERDDSGTVLLAEAVLDRADRAADDSERMPKSKGKEGDKGFRPALTDEEKAVLKQWVESGKPEEVKRDFISQTEVIRAIYSDLEKASETTRQYYRYLTLTNLHNQTDDAGRSLIADLDPHRAAIGKLMNSLSMNSRITFPTAIDKAETIYRIDLRDYNWDEHQWENIVSYYPYGITGIDKQKENLIAKHTGSKMAYLRADWFTFAAAQPPLYDEIMDKLLGINVHSEADNVLEMLDHALGVDRIGNLQKGRAMRAGFQYSGVSGANRLIERHEIGKYQGSYWVSYDFTPLSAERTHDLTLAPLGPRDAGLTDDPEHAFNHDGGEMVYNLPNGLQGYMLTTSKGKRLGRAPI